MNIREEWRIFNIREEWRIFNGNGKIFFVIVVILTGRYFNGIRCEYHLWRMAQFGKNIFQKKPCIIKLARGYLLLKNVVSEETVYDLINMPS